MGLKERVEKLEQRAGQGQEEIVISYLANWGRPDAKVVARRRLINGELGPLEHLDPEDERVKDAVARQPAKGYYGVDPMEWDNDPAGR